MLRNAVIILAISVLYGCSGNVRILNPMELARRAGDVGELRGSHHGAAAAIQRVAVHACFEGLLQGCEKVLVVELTCEGAEEPNEEYMAFAWFEGFLCFAEGENRLTVVALDEAQNKRLAKLLEALPNAELGRRFGTFAFDGFAVFVSGRIGNRVFQGFKINPDQPHKNWEELTDEKPHPEDLWLRDAVDILEGGAPNTKQ